MSLIRNKRWIHFIGIGGIGMSGLAELLLKLGSKVSGSDSQESETLKRLQSLGAIVFSSHAESNIEKVDPIKLPDCIVYSSAIPVSNPEIVFGSKKKIPIIRRAEMLAEIMRLKRGLAVAGSHGKTTTTGMISLILGQCGFDPTVVIGGKFDAIGSNAAWGSGDWMVAEADESDGSFLKLSPEIAVCTNIDKEHFDHYHNLDNAKESFFEFLDRIPFYGRAILCSDSQHLREVGERLRKPKLWYGFDQKAEPDFLIRIQSSDYPVKFSVHSKTDSYNASVFGSHLTIPGQHNISNATAAVLAARELGADLNRVSEILKQFKGVRKRFELKGKINNQHMVVEDYAHHPTEIEATLLAAKSYFGESSKLVVLFQPHRYSRTRDLWLEFSGAFKMASKVFTLPIYAASEKRDEWTEKFDGPNFATNVDAEFVPDVSTAAIQIRRYLDSKSASGFHTPLLVLGAGDVARVINFLGELT
jgi:UDP-N-acetylmuramate--alanine ligase